MSCNCENITCLETKYATCSEGAQLNIIADETGSWVGEIEFNGVWAEFTFGVINGQKIVIPTVVLNGFYTHTLKLYDTVGNLINDTCYALKTVQMQGAGTYSVIPASTAAELQAEINLLNATVVVLQEEIDVLQDEIGNMPDLFIFRIGAGGEATSNMQGYSATFANGVTSITFAGLIGKTEQSMFVGQQYNEAVSSQHTFDNTTGTITFTSELYDINIYFTTI